MTTWTSRVLTRYVVLTCFGCAVAACQAPSASGASGATSTAPDWLEGCWISGDGTTEENWRRSREGSQWFGYSVSERQGQPAFFEQLRLDRTETGYVIHAYPSGIGPTPFEGTLDGKRLSFTNPDNDYPQRITYEKVATGIRAEISMLDGSKATGWEYRPCEQ
ncbi:MAG: DUF6265 family protein [Pseudomonadota bacterium]